MLEDLLLFVATASWLFGALMSSGWEALWAVLSPVYAYYVLAQTVYWAYFYSAPVSF